MGQMNDIVNPELRLGLMFRTSVTCGADWKVCPPQARKPGPHALILDISQVWRLEIGD
jgi:hypothetical protein